MERPIHRVRGCCRPQEPPPPIVHAAPQSWRDPLSRRRPQVGPRQEGGESRLAGAGAATSAPNARAHRSMGARQARASGFCSPPGRLGHLRCGYLLARPVPAAARRPPLPSRRRAPPLAPSARPGPPDVGLAPPQPCGPEEAGPPGAGPAPAPARLPIGGRGPGLRFLPPWLGQPGQPPGPRLSSPSLRHPPLAPVPQSPPAPPLCADFLILKAQVYPFLAPIGLRQLQPLVGDTCPFPARVQPLPAGGCCGFIGCLSRSGWVLKGKAEPSFSPKRFQ